MYAALLCVSKKILESVQSLGEYFVNSNKIYITMPHYRLQSDYLTSSSRQSGSKLYSHLLYLCCGESVTKCNKCGECQDRYKYRCGGPEVDTQSIKILSAFEAL